MSTRAFIGIEVGKDAIIGIYNHSDGYPSYLGETLMDNYHYLNVWKLIALGDLDFCGKTLDKCDPFADSEDEERLMPCLYRNLEDIYEMFSDLNYAYLYYPDTDEWYYNVHAEDRKWKLLTKEICKED